MTSGTPSPSTSAAIGEARVAKCTPPGVVGCTGHPGSSEPLTLSAWTQPSSVLTITSGKLSPSRSASAGEAKANVLLNGLGQPGR